MALWGNVVAVVAAAAACGGGAGALLFCLLATATAEEEEEVLGMVEEFRAICDLECLPWRLVWLNRGTPTSDRGATGVRGRRR